MTIHKKQTTIKIVTYNIHKGKSFIFRKNIIKEIKSLLHLKEYDFIFLQEVRDFHEKDYKKHNALQTDMLSSGNYQSFYGKNRIYKQGHHGNAILTNHKVLDMQNFDISVNTRESRGFFVLKVETNGIVINIACTHLNLKKTDRLKQIQLIQKIIDKHYANEPFILAGDFNDFDKSIEHKLKDFDFHNLTQIKSFPHIFPLFNLDKIFIKNIKVKKVNSYILKPTNHFMLSDHLPIEMDLTFSI